MSGYIDTLRDPEGIIADADFDPIEHTIRNELAEECQLSLHEVEKIEFHMGERFSERRSNGGTLHVIPILGICVGGKSQLLRLMRMS